MRPRSRRRSMLWLLGDVDRAVDPRRRLPVLGFLWRWRKELPLLACVAIVCLEAWRLSGIVGAIVGLSAMVGMFSPPWSSRLTAFAWQLITPHLLRSGLYQAHIQNRSGMCPLIVRVTREPFGERVRLWCPPGVAPEDLISARAVLRAACWATDVRITRDQKRSQMVTVDVIRRRDDADLVGGTEGESGSAEGPGQGADGSGPTADATGADPTRSWGVCLAAVLAATCVPFPAATTAQCPMCGAAVGEVRHECRP